MYFLQLACIWNNILPKGGSVIQNWLSIPIDQNPSSRLGFQKSIVLNNESGFFNSSERIQSLLFLRIGRSGLFTGLMQCGPRTGGVEKNSDSDFLPQLFKCFRS